MSSCAPDRPPIFWQPQSRLPVPVMRFLRVRLEAALEHPDNRALLAWPAILGAPGIRAQHPEGFPEPLLLEQATRMLKPLGVEDLETAWEAAQAMLPDTADLGATGWLPQRVWEPLADQVSLRCGVTLLALMGHPPSTQAYRLSAGVALFNSALFHESHDAFEPLWLQARGHLKSQLQGLIMLAGGFYHHQLHHVPGMTALWEDAQRILGGGDPTVDTPWGRIDFTPALTAVEERVLWLEGRESGSDLSPLWAMKRPALELLP